jgi:hypothetical protein
MAAMPPMAVGMPVTVMRLVMLVCVRHVVG